MCLAVPQVAHGMPTVAACVNGDAPDDQWDEDCTLGGIGPLCTVGTDGILTCDFDVGACNTGVGVHAVNFRNTQTISVWGNCTITTTERFCCKVTDSAAELNGVHLLGLENLNDKMFFRFQQLSTTIDLRPTGSQKFAAAMQGLSGSDELHGSGSTSAQYGEQIWGGPGVDTIHGNAGDDSLYGGDDGDIVHAGAGKDTVYGGNGGDTLNGGDGNDTLYGGPGTDTLNGDADEDTLLGGNQNDTLNGGLHDDRLHGGNDNDTMSGEGGDDILYGSAGGDILNGGIDDDYLCDTPFVGPCAVTNTFNGGDGYDRAYLNGGIFNGNMWCESMVQGGDNTVELMSHPNRDWSNVKDLQTGAEVLFSEPGVCADLRTLGGD